jgi:basic membrane lipoprotein Med (substrate-binding protein (PBP1-ABC) superfamily)
VQAHIYAFGANGDQNAVAPDNVLASAGPHIPQAFVRIATENKSGEFRGRMLEYGMKEGMVEVVYNPRLESKIPAATLEKAKAAEPQIIAGKIVLE